MDELVRLITEQVLASLHNENNLAETGHAGKKKCLVLGEAEHMPEALAQDMILLDVKDYETTRDILRYDRVLITKLTMRQLANLAMGCPGDSLCCAVCQALLQGVDVLMTQDAAPHRRYAGKGSPAFYRMLEGYMNTLQEFGVKLIQKDEPLADMPVNKQDEPGWFEVTDTKLITVEMAERLVKRASALVVPTGTLITPAAMDVFKEARTALTRR